eukprot:40772_1
MVQILKLNGIEYNEAKINNIININENNKHNIINEKLYLGSEIEFKKEYEFYIIETSQNEEWHAQVTSALSKLFDNNKTTFYVGNASALSAHIEEEPPLSPSFSATFGTLNAILIICMIISALAYFYNSYSY